MPTQICWGLVGPDGFTDPAYESPRVTPDPETLRIMQTHDPYAKDPSSGGFPWSVLSPEERQATQERQSRERFEGFGKRVGSGPAKEPISGVPYDDIRVYQRNEGEEWNFGESLKRA